MSYVYDNLKLFFSFRKHQDTPITHASAGSTSFTQSGDNYISVDALSSTNHTFSLWAYPTLSGSSQHRHIIDTRDTGNDGVRLALNPSDQVYYDVNSSALTTSSTWDSEWLHICGTYDGTTQKLYINGVLEQSGATSQTISTTVSSIIGGRSFLTMANNFDGKMSNFGFWSRALSASEVQGIMYKKYADLGSADQVSLVSWYGLDAESLGSELVTNGTFDTDSDWTLPTGVTISGGSLNFAGSSSETTTASNINVEAGKMYRIVFTISNYVSGSVKINTNGAFGNGAVRSANGTYTEDLVGVGSGTFRLWASVTFQFSIDNISIKEITLEDSQGTNHGTPVGATTNATVYGGNAPSKPRILDSAPDVVDNYGTLHSGTALSFDGTNDYVDTGDIGDIFGTSFAISMWVNPDTVSTRRELIGQYVDADDWWRFCIDGAGNWEIDVEDTTVRTVAVNPTSSLIVGSWQYVVLSRSGSDWNFYLNGELDSTASDDSTIPDYSANLIIGNATGDNWDGKISSVKVFNSALTLAQIQEMYLNPEQILPTGVASSNLKLYLPMNEGSGTTVYDGSVRLGTELVSNGTFATGDYTGWDTNGNGWSVSDYVATFAYTDEGNSKLVQDIGISSGQTYTLTFDYTRTAGSLTVREYSSGYVTLGTYSDASGSVELNFTSASSNGNIYITAVSTTFAGTIDNISIKEVIGQNHGAIVNGATWVKAETEIAQVGLVRQNKPMVFDGSNDEVRFTGITLPKENWATQVVFTWGASASTADLLGTIDQLYYSFIRFASTTSLVIEPDTDGQAITLSTQTMVVGKTYDVVLTGNASGTQLYINGVLDVSTSTALYDDITIERIGYGYNGNWMAGIIHSVGLYDTVLTATEVTALYNSGTPLDASADSGNYASSIGLQGYWRNDGDTTWEDRTPLGAYGSELVTNGTFDSNITGWSDISTGSGSIAWNSSGYMEVVGLGLSDRGKGVVSVSITSGKSYQITYTRTDQSNPAVYLGSSSGGTQYSSNLVNGDIFIATGTTAYLTFSEAGSGTQKIDNVSIKRYRGGNDGTVAGSPTSIVLTEGITSGRDSQGFYLKDTDENVLTLNGAEYVEVPDSDTLDFSNPFSCEAWIKPNSFGTHSRIIDKSEDANSTNGWYLRLNSSGDENIVVRIDAGTSVTSAPDSITLNAWNHVAITTTATGLTTIYINGSVSGTPTISKALSNITTTDSLFLGQFKNTSNPFDGDIDDVRIYSDALSATEVLKNYNSGKSQH